MAGSIGFIGAGNMTAAMAKALEERGLFQTYKFMDINPGIVARLCQHAPQKFSAAENYREIAKCNVIVLAVKALNVREACSPLKGLVNQENLIISIMGGIPIKLIKEVIGDVPRIIRAMPNACMMIGKASTGIAALDNVDESDRKLAYDMFSSMGVAVEVKEKYIDAVTGVSGSGPAYAAVFMDALADAGVRAGLKRNVAMKLAAGVLAGSGSMVTSGKVPSAAKLKEMVCSPGGTSIAGVAALEEKGLRAAVFAAVEASQKRGREIGETAMRSKL